MMRSPAGFADGRAKRVCRAIMQPPNHGAEQALADFDTMDSFEAFRPSSNATCSAEPRVQAPRRHGQGLAFGVPATVPMSEVTALPCTMPDVLAG